MDQKMKKELKRLYEAPEPVGKRAFFRELSPRPVSTGYMLWMQISYISKWEWICSGVFFGTVIILSYFYQTKALGIILAMMPFLAVAGVSESMRSVTYGMDELEMSARFSLKSIVLARMWIIGTENLALALVAGFFMKENFVQMVLYLMVPYLLTVYGSLLIVRHMPGREGIYACMGLSVVISMSILYSILSYDWIYQEQFGFFWFLVVMALLYMDVKESRQTVQMISAIVEMK